VNSIGRRLAQTCVRVLVQLVILSDIGEHRNGYFSFHL